MGREVSEWFPDGRGGGDTGESPWAVRLAATLVTCSPREGKKDLCPESETSANGLRSPSLSFGSPRLVDPQPSSVHPPRVPGTAGKPAGTLISL